MLYKWLQEEGVAFVAVWEGELFAVLACQQQIWAGFHKKTDLSPVVTGQRLSSQLC